MRFVSTIAGRLILVVTLSTSLIFALMLGFNHQRARGLVEREAAASAHHLAQASVNKVEAALATVARATDNLARQMQGGAVAPAQLEPLLRRLLAETPEILGSGVWFEPGGLPGKRGPFAPYVYREGEAIRATPPKTDFGYTLQDWYQIPRELARADWSEPYYDPEVPDVLMATYTVPLYAGSGEDRRFIGVLTADISLEWLSRMMGSIKVLDSGYAFVLSQSGAVVTHPRAERIMNETLFTLAEASADPALRAVGRRMQRSETDFVAFSHLDGVPARLYFGPIPAVGWSLAIVFPERELFAAIGELTTTVALMAALGIALIAAVVVKISRTITRPLHQLAKAAQRMRGGQFDVELPAQDARDEVGDLSRAFASMNHDLQQHIRELVATTSAKERIEGELSVAHDIQMSMLPKMLPPFPSREEFNLYAMIEPAKEVGGDFYDFFQLDDDHLCVVVADVSGKGVPASLFMAVTKTLIKATARVGLSPADILGHVNDQIARDNDQSMFVTVFFGILDLRNGEMVFTNAGHNPPLLLPTDGEPRYLPKAGQLVIGAMDGFVYRAETLQLSPGDRLLMYTDGVTEAMNLQDELFAEERLMATCLQSGRESVDRWVRSTLASVKEFAREAPQSDDITLMALEFRGRKPRP